jgi:RNA 2',3'-cyclic 3'-phosphodiesterase
MTGRAARCASTGPATATSFGGARWRSPSTSCDGVSCRTDCLRLFFAVELPAEVRAAIARARDALALDPRAFRAGRAGAFHLTLRFLGEVEESRVPVLVSAGERAAASARPTPCELSGAGAFPKPGRARVVWLGVVDRSATEELRRLADRLENEVRAAGFPPEARAFAPHVTIARARGPGGSAVRLPEGVGAGPTFVADELALVRSRLDPSGARYEAIASFPFLAGPS